MCLQHDLLACTTGWSPPGHHQKFYPILEGQFHRRNQRCCCHLPPPPVLPGHPASKKDYCYYYDNHMSTKIYLRMPTYMVTMTILFSFLCPSELRHSFTRIPDKGKPGMRTPSKGGCLTPPTSIIVSIPCVWKIQERQGYQAWYF